MLHFNSNPQMTLVSLLKGASKRRFAFLGGCQLSAEVEAWRFRPVSEAI